MCSPPERQLLPCLSRARLGGARDDEESWRFPTPPRACHSERSEESLLFLSSSPSASSLARITPVCLCRGTPLLVSQAEPPVVSVVEPCRAHVAPGCAPASFHPCPPVCPVVPILNSAPHALAAHCRSDLRFRSGRKEFHFTSSASRVAATSRRHSSAGPQPVGRVPHRCHSEPAVAGEESLLLLSASSSASSPRSTRLRSSERMQAV